MHYSHLYEVIKSLEISKGNELSPRGMVKYFNQALQVDDANKELHKATHIFNTITNAVKCTLKIYLKCKKNMVFKYPTKFNVISLTQLEVPPT